MELHEEDMLKKYSYAKGTDFYLANCKNPIDYKITMEGDTYVFTPSEIITNSFSGTCTAVIKDKSLLSGAAQVMALAANYCVRTSFKTEQTSRHKVDDPRFQIPKDKASVNLYIDYTNNMVLPDNTEYAPLAQYIFPNSRHSKYSMSSNYLPKNLLNIQLKDDIHIQDIRKYDAKHYYKKFIEAFKEEKTLEVLKALKIKDQIDYPTHLTIFGIANVFADKSNHGLVGILYIQHKTSMKDIQKYRDLCDESLNEQLKPLNLTVKDIINMTDEKLKKEYNAFPKIDNLMQACSKLFDPRSLEGLNEYGSKHTFTYFLIRFEAFQLDDTGGLKRWGEIKNVYPELYSGLKKIWQYYNIIAAAHDKKCSEEYNEKFNNIANKYYNSLLNANGNIINDKRVALKIINDTLSKIDKVNIDNWEDMIDTIDLVNQNILDKLSELYTLQGKQMIAEYKKEHPRAKKMELEINSELLRCINSRSGQANLFSELFNYKLFKVDYLPEEYQKILNMPELGLLKDNLEKLSLFYGGSMNAYVNYKKLMSKHKTEKNILIFYIENIDDALNSFSIELTNNIIYRDNSVSLVDSRTLQNALHKIYIGQNRDSSQVILYNDYEKIINIIISSGSISFKLIWENSSPSYKRPSVLSPISFLNDMKSQSEWGIYGDKTIDDIFKNNNLESTIHEYMTLKIIPVYDKEALLNNLDKFKQVYCIKEALQKKENFNRGFN